ncbi:MAG: hypothetical protein ACI4QX_02305, partial [Lachnospiraceae bacterium]
KISNEFSGLSYCLIIKVLCRFRSGFVCPCRVSKTDYITLQLSCQHFFLTFFQLFFSDFSKVFKQHSMVEYPFFRPNI